MAEALFKSTDLTAPKSFTSGAEGPGCDRAGNLYAVNFERQGTIGKVTPEGAGSVFLELPGGSIGNGIRFNGAGEMFIADYTNHNVLRVDMAACERAHSLAERSAAISVHAHEPKMNQPNDIAIMRNGTIFASDPKWSENWGQIWRADPDGRVTLLETGMGTTNGIEVSPDESTLYVNETRQLNVWAYDLSPRGQGISEISNKRLLIRFDDYGMDGMRCDSAGNLYITRWSKGTIAIVSPGGALLREVELAGKNCTNLAFGGPDGRTCYVTVADRGNVESFRTDLPGREWEMWR